MAAGPELAWILLLALAKDPVAGANDPIPFRVEFDAPTGCPDVETFYAGVLSRSDRARRAGASEPGLRLGVRLTRVGGKVHGELRVLDGRGETDTRKMEGVRCDEVVEVLSLTAALAIDPAARIAPTRPAKPPASALPPETAATTEPPPAPPLPPEPPPAPPTVIAPADVGPPHTFAFTIVASTVGAQVIAPSIDLGGALSARFGRVRTDQGAVGPSLTLTGIYLSNDLVQSATDVAIAFVGGAVTACPGWSAGSTIVIEPCAHAMGGRVSAGGRGLTDPMSATRSWWSVGALGRASLAIGAGFALELEVGVTVPLTRRSFSSDTPERTVGETPTVSAMAGIGLSRRL